MLFSSHTCLITGGAGFIGSNLADALLAKGARVIVYDNLSTGLPAFLSHAKTHPNFSFVEGNILDESRLAKAMHGVDIVFHLAANADVRFGLEHPRKDLEQNTIGTSHVLEAMRTAGVSRIYFASTGSVYGESSIFPTPENAPFPTQTSLYAASKLAGEALISAYAEGFGFRGAIFRFVSVLGERYTHGHIFDFLNQLRADPTTLTIQGDGSQRKSYLYVGDCIDAMLHVAERNLPKLFILNLGYPEYITVNQSIDWIVEALALSPTRRYSGGLRGWVGDNPFIFLDTKHIESLGWKPKISIQEAVQKTVHWLLKNPDILTARA